MIEKLKYIFWGALALSVAGCCTACDEETAEFDEWGSNYVYLERLQLGVSGLEFKQTHSSLGVAGDMKVEIPLAVRLYKTCESNVSVKLSYAVEGGMPEDVIVFKNGGTVIIPAGELVVNDTLQVVTDWKFAPKEATAYKITASIESVEPASDQLRISSKQKSLSASITKNKLTDIQANVKPDGIRIADRSGWMVYTTPTQGSDVSWNKVTELNDGNTSNYIWYNKPYLGVKIDLGSTMTISGLENYVAYGASYAMSSCAVYTSDDNVNWTLVTPEDGLAINTGYTQYVWFIAPVTGRYIIWHMYGSSCLSSELYVYTK